MEKVKVAGHKGTWYALSNMTIDYKGKPTKVYLMEHETYGDEADSIIIDADANVIMENVVNGFEDLKYCIEEGIPFGDN